MKWSLSLLCVTDMTTYDCFSVSQQMNEESNSNIPTYRNRNSKHIRAAQEISIFLIAISICCFHALSKFSMMEVLIRNKNQEFPTGINKNITFSSKIWINPINSQKMCDYLIWLFSLLTAVITSSLEVEPCMKQQKVFLETMIFNQISENYWDYSHVSVF